MSVSNSHCSPMRFSMITPFDSIKCFSSTFTLSLYGVAILILLHSVNFSASRSPVDVVVAGIPPAASDILFASFSSHPGPPRKLPAVHANTITSTSQEANCLARVSIISEFTIFQISSFFAESPSIEILAT